MSKQDYGHAITDFDEGIRLKPESRSYFKRGVAYIHRKDFDQAISDFDEAIRLYPEASVYYAYRGLAWYGKRDYDQAIKDYDEAIRLKRSPYYLAEAVNLRKKRLEQLRAINTAEGIIQNELRTIEELEDACSDASEPLAE